MHSRQRPASGMPRLSQQLTRRESLVQRGCAKEHVGLVTGCLHALRPQPLQLRAAGRAGGVGVVLGRGCTVGARLHWVHTELLLPSLPAAVALSIHSAERPVCQACAQPGSSLLGAPESALHGVAVHFKALLLDVRPRPVRAKQLGDVLRQAGQQQCEIDWAAGAGLQLRLRLLVPTLLRCRRARAQRTCATVTEAPPRAPPMLAPSSASGKRLDSKLGNSSLPTNCAMGSYSLSCSGTGGWGWRGAAP